MVFTFTGYDILDGGIMLHFHTDAPGANRPTEWDVWMTDAELGAITTQAQFLAAVNTKLARKFNGVGISTKLDAFIGRSTTI